MIIPEANRLGNVKEYYFSRKLQEVADMRANGIDVISLGIDNPDMPPAPQVVDALKVSASDVTNHGYQSYKSIPELRTEIANWNKRFYGIDLDGNSEILPLIGSKEGIMHTSMAFLNPGDEVLLPNPGYPTYTSVSNLVGASIRYYELDENADWDINIEQLKQQDLSKVKLMWVNYPNMPTGAKGSDNLFEELIKLAKEHKFLIVNDNPYSLILNNEPQSIFNFEGAKDVALELNSLSKSHNMAGWRVGWIAGKSDYIQAILKVKSNVDTGKFLPIQHAAVEALKIEKDWHDTQNKEYAERRKLVWELLDVLDCKYSEDRSGMFVWAKIPDSINNIEGFIDDILQKAHVFATPGSIFGSKGDRYVRISLCNKQDKIKQATERLRKVLKGVESDKRRV